MIAYFDTSALIKLLAPEPDSQVVREVRSRSLRVLSSRIAHVELRTALASMVRAGRLSRSARERALRDAGALWDRVQPVELTPLLAAAAGPIGEAGGLGALDAIHLTAALVVRPAPVMVTWDDRLRTAARDAGLAVVER